MFIFCCRYRQQYHFVNLICTFYASYIFNTRVCPLAIFIRMYNHNVLNLWHKLTPENDLITPGTVPQDPTRKDNTARDPEVTLVLYENN